jgi:hypothetical protein
MQASCLPLLMIGITRVVLLSLLFPILIPPNPVWTDTNDDDSQTVDPQYQYPLVQPFQDQLESHQNSLEKQSDLPTCLSQGQNVRNIQGHIEIERTFSDVCESTDNEIPLGVQDDDISQEQPNDLRECTVQEKNIQGRAIIGTIFADVCEGTDHSETILGLQDNDDILSGEDGNDKLFGWFGNDMLKGGPGSDQFLSGEGIDKVLDYNPAKGDVISNDCEIVNTGK